MSRLFESYRPRVLADVPIDLDELRKEQAALDLLARIARAQRGDA